MLAQAADPFWPQINGRLIEAGRPPTGASGTTTKVTGSPASRPT
jgi:hypothetical protein